VLSKVLNLFPSILNNRRARLLWFASTRANSGLSLEHFLLNTLGPTAGMCAARDIERVESCGSAIRVFLKGRADPLYLPSTMPRQALNMVLGESRAWHWHCYETAETRVTAEDIVFDCGAAEGFFSFSAAPRARQVYAFEPLPEFRECLELTFAGRANVTVVPVGLSDQAGSAFIRTAGLASELTTDPTPNRVEVETIDNFCSRTGVVPTYLKADVEGFERKLISGARQTIKSHKPRIAITTYHAAGDATALALAIKTFNPSYRLKLKGLEHKRGDPLMLHAW
jgi:FkbM family methyltransferase